MADKNKGNKEKAKNKKSPGKIKLEKIKITTENKCSHCIGSKCCTYVTHNIDAPKSKADFDYLLWQISHRDIQVFKDDDGWFLSILQPCVHLLTDGGCGIYDVRPMICREHSNEYCEFDSPAEEGFDLFFDGYKALNDYCKKRFKKWDKRFTKLKKDS
ncbi:MAG: YkgJ family cysteine cluster protein [Gammaproteobacteria bacterium]|nr:YkgJ family cysteine cluster protein [Gammaproteobacteria bacterium]